MPLEDVQSLQSDVDSIGLGDLDQTSIPEEGAEDSEEEEAGDLDPRVQVELEKLNEATDVINKYEAQLDEAKAAGRHAFCDMTRKLQELAEKLGKCIQKSRPYYEARVELKKAQTELQQAALLFEKANASLKASKEIVKLTEEGLTRQGGKLDETWQEMLNYSTKKVAQCEGDVRLRQRDHWQASKVCAETEIKVRLLEKKFKSSINKSKSYYELRSQMNHFVEREKLRVHQLEQSIAHAKSAYSEGLTALEGISEQIHLKRLRRKESLTQQRDSGCGTISDSASVNDASSLDVASLADTNLPEHLLPPTSQTPPRPSSKQQAMLDNLHDLFSSQPTKQQPREKCTEDPLSSLSELLPRSRLPSAIDQSVTQSATAAAAAQQSYPLLNALEKELNRLQLEQQTAPKKRALQTVTSVDSAMDSGSEECGEEFDAPNDETIQGLHLENGLNF
ncbi:putative SH3 domain-binding protein 5-like [Hypsibius exemplaris]|uniref:SH3 domain-binding protein 5-like n=1 Tax=Hypsibius exemplaris TaxID=2072580 RepID=A0A1W0WK63_HYPEX|nr:putative SH3 domain-binding protein 5-like [Hypsibius exemplaris]